MKNVIAGIYCIENLVNHRKYVGQSTNIFDRWRRHIYALNQGSHENDYLQKSWVKYGQDNFSFSILEKCEETQLNDKERYYIEKFNTLNRECGYNLKSGGQDSNFYTDEVKDRIRKGVKASYDDPDRRKIQRENALKQWSDPTIKSKILGENNGMYGRHHTEESKRKMGEKKKGQINWRRDRTPVFCVELNKIFQDSTAAGKELSLDGSCILKVCKGKRHTCGGYHWKFVNGE